jgi:hypothetical protein
MKYLVKFNEDLVNREELKDFCEMYLAYLVDDNIKISVVQNNILYKNKGITREPICINIHGFMGYENTFLTFDNQASFKTWGEIKDHFIPFIQMLDNNYNIADGKSIEFIDADITIKFTKDEIINDVPNDNIQLHYIRIFLDKNDKLFTRL